MRITACFTLAALMASGCSETAPTTSTESSSDQTASAPAGQSDHSSDSPESQDPSKPTATAETMDNITERIQGRWVIVEANVSGQAMDAMKGTVAEINGNEITVATGGQQTTSTLAFKEGSTPLQFDAVSAAGQAAKAILELSGDELTVNTSLTGEAYPESFEPGAGLMLVKYKRE